MNGTANPPLRTRRLQRFGIYATAVFTAFLLGFVPMWLTGRTCANERDAAQQSVRMMRIEGALAAAAIQARRGDYEPAREAASTFYTDLRSELDRRESAYSMAQRDGLQSLLAQRDLVITLLARSDPAVAERLADTYMSYRRAGAATGQSSAPDGTNGEW